MSNIKTKLIQFLSIGIGPHVDESKKLALRLAFFDGWASLITVGFYVLYSFYFDLAPLTYFHMGGFVAMSLALALMHSGKYDSGRALMQFSGTYEIFIAVDAVGFHHGYEYYYFINIVIPFLVFTNKEHKKATLLSLGTGVIIFCQHILGANLFSEKIQPPTLDSTVAFVIVVGFTIVIFAIARWLMWLTQQEIEKQQKELVQQSNILALGEMAGGIAHEIQNPLQILSMNVEYLKKRTHDGQWQLEEVPNRVSSMERMVERMTKIVKSLRNLSRNINEDSLEVFTLAEVLEDVKTMSEQKLRTSDVFLKISGELEVSVEGEAVQLSQVLINLVNNAVDAMSGLDEKWIFIDVKNDGLMVQIGVVDAGRGIPQDIARDIMKPFYTTKHTSNGTGLGLSISQGIIEKKGGSLYYDARSIHTRFVIELPVYLK